MVDSTIRVFVHYELKILHTLQYESNAHVTI
jgi:hypothetical protein